MKKIRNILLYTTALVFFLLLGCVREAADREARMYTGERLEMSAHFPYSKTLLGDARIATVRVIVFSSKGELVFNDTVSKTNTVNGVAFTLKVARGINNFYVICNETAELKSKLAGLDWEGNIENTILQTAGITPPLPMYGKVMRALVTANDDGSNVQVAVDGSISNSLTIYVDRLLAKLNMTVIKNITDANVDFKVDEIRMQVCRMPKYTILKPGQPYTGTQWADNCSYTGVGKLVNNGEYVKIAGFNTIPAGVDSIKFSDIYLPEHLLVAPENEAEATYLLIEMTYRMNKGNTAEMRTTYILPIGQNPPLNHNLTRNHHYDIYATIRGLGTMGIYAEILPFTEYQHPVEWEPFEGYTIVSEKESEFGKNANIWNDYSQYSGILKIIKNKTVSPALFRYGSLIALQDGTTAGPFNAATDVIWSGNNPVPANWDGVSYQSSGNIVHTLESVRQGKGDPCRLVGLTSEEIGKGVIDNKLWRMPTAIEMEWLNTARNTIVKPDGFYSFLSLLTPKTGYRTEAGDMSPAATEGRYWSSTEANSFIFSTANNTKLSSTVDNPKQAYGVRCIRVDEYRHGSRFSISSVDLDWQGRTDVKAGIADNFLVPYWKLTPVPAAGISYSVTQGGSDVTAAVFSVTQLPNPYVARTFNAKVVGYGLDGVVHEYDIEITQQSLKHDIILSLQSPNLSFENGFLRIPKEGATLKIKMSITPSPFPPYDATFGNLRWKTIGYWYDDQGHYWNGTEVSTSGESEVVVQPNTWGHIISVEALFSWLSPAGECPPTNPTGKIRFVQEK